MIPMKLNDIIDRFTIAYLKYQRISEADFKDEICEYWDEITEPMYPYLSALFYINKEIWDREYAIRNAQDEQLGYEEIGRRACAIRDANQVRIAIKNMIAKEFGGYLDVKMNYTKANVGDNI